jgi:hypothetical protein
MSQTCARFGFGALSLKFAGVLYFEFCLLQQYLQLGMDSTIGWLTQWNGTENSIRERASFVLG